MSTPITFVPNVGPSTSTSVTHRPAIYQAEYGDGYTQRAAAGIQARRLSATVIWNVLEHSDALQISNFFRDRGGFEPFIYILPPDTVGRRWICTEWARREVGELASEISATWQEVFDI